MADVARVLHDHITELPRTRPVGIDQPVGGLSRVRRHALRRLVFADAVGLAFAALLGPRILAALSDDPAIRTGQVYRFDVAMIPLFLAVFALYGLYRGVRRRISTSVFSDLRNILDAVIISGFLYAVVAYVIDKNLHDQSLSVAAIVSMCVLAMVTVPLARVAAFGVIGRHSIGTIPVIVVGTGKLAQTVASHLRAHPNVQFVGFVDDDPLGRSDLLGQLDELPVLCRQFQVARVVVCFSRTHPERTSEMLKGLAAQVGVSIVPRYYELLTARSHVEDLSGLPMLDIAPPSLSVGARFLKRAFDIVVSSAVLLAASPLLVAIAIMIKVTTPGPVFFRQMRTGRNEQPFAVLKFRTMYRDAEARRARARAPQRDGRPAVQGAGRSPGHPDRPLPAADQPGRVPAADQRLEGRHVPGGTASVRGGGGHGDRGVGPQAVRSPAGHDRSLAGLGAERALAPRALPARLSLRGVVVLLVGHGDPLADSPRHLPGPGRLLIRDTSPAGVARPGWPVRVRPPPAPRRPPGATGG